MTSTKPPTTTLTALTRRLLHKRRIDPATGCWLWQGGRDPKGYGQLSHAGRPWRVHVLAALLWKGGAWTLAGGGQQRVGRTCAAANCFNPDHLVVGSATAVGRAQAKLGRFRCGEAHPRHRLSEMQARAVLAADKLGRETPDELAGRLGVPTRLVWDIVTGRTWKHLRPDSKQRKAA